MYVWIQNKKLHVILMSMFSIKQAMAHFHKNLGYAQIFYFNLKGREGQWNNEFEEKSFR